MVAPNSDGLRSRVSVLLLFLLALIPARTEAAYIAEEVAVLPEGSERVVRALNENNAIVGGTAFDDFQSGFRLTPGAIQIITGRPGTDYSVAFGINDLGEIVGSANATRGVRAFRRAATGATLDLGTLPGDSGSEAFAVNQLGQVSGYSSGPSGARAVIWSRSGGIQPLANPGSKSSKGLAINDRGEVVGISGTGSNTRAVMWKSRAVHELGALPGHRMSEALSINNKGEIVGSSGDTAVDRRAVLWAVTGAIQDLGTLPGGVTSRALSISDRGTVVGASDSGSGTRAFLWTPGAGMQDLNGLLTARSGFVLVEAVSVNERGVILAIGQDEAVHTGGDEEHKHDVHELPLRVFRLIPSP